MHAENSVEKMLAVPTYLQNVQLIMRLPTLTAPRLGCDCLSNSCSVDCCGS